MKTATKTLPDYLKPGLDILFVGINPGVRSAEIGHHYAGHSNRFWKLLNETKLIPCKVTYRDDWRLLEWGIGFTNIVSRTTAGSGDLGTHDYVVGRASLAEKIRQYRPHILALLGLTLYPIVFPQHTQAGVRSGGKSSLPKIGLLPNVFENSRVVLLPNPSGRNAHYSYQDMLKGFAELNQLRLDLQTTRGELVKSASSKGVNDEILLKQ